MKEYSKEEIINLSLDNSFEGTLPSIIKYAEENDPQFIGLLGYCYAYGFEIEQDVIKGIKLLEQAANSYDLQSTLYLGEIYSDQYILPHNYKKALNWYKFGYDNGSAICGLFYNKISKLYSAIEKGILSEEETKNLFYKKQYFESFESIIYYSDLQKVEFMCFLSYFCKYGKCMLPCQQYGKYLIEKSLKLNKNLTIRLIKELNL